MSTSPRNPEKSASAVPTAEAAPEAVPDAPAAAAAERNKNVPILPNFLIMCAKAVLPPEGRFCQKKSALAKPEELVYYIISNLIAMPILRVERRSWWNYEKNGIGS